MNSRSLKGVLTVDIIRCQPELIHPLPTMLDSSIAKHPLPSTRNLVSGVTS
ncbi:hypothetical protein [Planktothricoides raciborskii]|uniref:Uncharacterized protein n=1 Tax=Planktothricoides raciborskii GIHE-MW2 TaxID=2792601 RepID=A0AAU8JB99_9CYAN